MKNIIECCRRADGFCKRHKKVLVALLVIECVALVALHYIGKGLPR